MLEVETILDDKSYKNTIETNYQTPYMQLILFGILYDFVDLQIQSQSKGLWSTQQNLFQKVIKKWFKHNDHIIDEFNN